MSETIAHPKIVTNDEWLAERRAFLAREKEFTKQRDALNADRRRLPMEKVEKHYEFDSPEERVTLEDLFEGRRQLIVYHFMFDPEWDEGCTGCTGFVDALGDLSMLSERETSFVLVSRAPLAKLIAYKADHGWEQRWVSSFGSEFNYDFHVTADPAIAPPEYNYRSSDEWVKKGEAYRLGGEQHGLSVFFLLEDGVYHTYSAYARGVENLTNSYELLDVTPYGRQEDFEDSPPGWPQKPTYG